MRAGCRWRLWPGQPGHSRRDAWLVSRWEGLLIEKKPMKAKCIDRSPTVGHKRSNQAAERLRFVLLRRRVSNHMMIWAWRKANPQYVVMRLPEKKPASTACSSWTSPELGLPRYLDGPKTVVWLFWRQSVGASAKTVDQSVKYDCKKDTVRTGAARQDIVLEGECSLLKPKRQEYVTAKTYVSPPRHHH